MGIGTTAVVALGASVELVATAVGTLGAATGKVAGSPLALGCVCVHTAEIGGSGTAETFGTLTAPPCIARTDELGFNTTAGVMEADTVRS